MGNALNRACRRLEEGDASLLDLDLTWSGIDDAGARKLSTSLKRNRYIQRLTLARNRIGDDGCRALASTLRSTTTIGSGSSQNNHSPARSQGSGSSSGLSSTFLHSGGDSPAHLVYLDLSSNKIGPAGVAALASALRVNRVVEEVWLNRNRIADDGVVSLADVLGRKTCTLRVLGLSHNFISSEGAAVLAQALRSNFSLVKLNLYGNDIGDVGARAIVDAVQKSNYTLSSLDLMGNGIKDYSILSTTFFVSCGNWTGLRSANPCGSTKDVLTEATPRHGERAAASNGSVVGGGSSVGGALTTTRGGFFSLGGMAPHANAHNRRRRHVGEDDGFDTDEEGECPLHAAVKYGNMEVLVEDLQETYSEDELNKLDSLGRTACDLAALRGELEMLKLLEQRGGKFNIGSKARMRTIAKEHSLQKLKAQDQQAVRQKGHSQQQPLHDEEWETQQNGTKSKNNNSKRGHRSSSSSSRRKSSSSSVASASRKQQEHERSHNRRRRGENDDELEENSLLDDDDDEDVSSLLPIATSVLSGSGGGGGNVTPTASVVSSSAYSHKSHRSRVTPTKHLGASSRKNGAGTTSKSSLVATVEQVILAQQEDDDDDGQDVVDDDEENHSGRQSRNSNKLNRGGGGGGEYYSKQ